MTEWTPETVASRFHEAARTAHRLPPVRVQGYFSVWPAFVREKFERMACDDIPPPRFMPNPAEIERMLEVMQWVQCLDVEQRHLVWMRAQCYRWDDIAKRLGCATRTAQRRWNSAIHGVTHHLTQKN